MQHADDLDVLAGPLKEDDMPLASPLKEARTLDHPAR